MLLYYSSTINTKTLELYSFKKHVKDLHLIMNEFCKHAEDILYKTQKHRIECKTVQIHNFNLYFRELPIFLFFVTPPLILNY